MWLLTFKRAINCFTWRVLCFAKKNGAVRNISNSDNDPGFEPLTFRSLVGFISNCATRPLCNAFAPLPQNANEVRCFLQASQRSDKGEARTLEKFISWTSFLEKRLRDDDGNFLRFSVHRRRDIGGRDKQIKRRIRGEILKRQSSEIFKFKKCEKRIQQKKRKTELRFE